MTFLFYIALTIARYRERTVAHNVFHRCQYYPVVDIFSKKIKLKSKQSLSPSNLIRLMTSWYMQEMPQLVLFLYLNMLGWRLCFVSSLTTGPLFTKHRKISWSREAARLDVILIVSPWSLTGISAALLSICLSNFRATVQVYTRISRFRDFTRYCGKTSYRLVNRGRGEKFFLVGTQNVPMECKSLHTTQHHWNENVTLTKFSTMAAKISLKWRHIRFRDCLRGHPLSIPISSNVYAW